MERLIARYKGASALPPSGRVPALDGLRFVMVFSVACFHLWQQSWLAPSFTLLGQNIGLDPWLRTGYLWVDGMLLLSGFLLFLPYARAREAGRAMLGFSGFYRRRFLRIFPTYALNLLIVFLLVALPERRYATIWEGLRDWLAHLSFTHPLFPFSNTGTPLNGVLWTLGVEMQFYLVFPLVARAFIKMPLASYTGLAAIAFAFRALAMGQAESPMLVNQLPAFLDIYMNGFIAAWAFARLEKTLKDDGLSRVLMSAVLLAALLGLAELVRGQAALNDIPDLRIGQLMRRFPQSVLTALALIGASLGLGGIRLALGNPVAGWLSAISYQFYMWHLVIALQLKKWRFPPSVSDQPQVLGDRAWQIPYLLISLALCILISAVITFLIEQPIAAWGNRRLAKRRKNR
jgi:peptidoglycan/LPS O-acetylase OafA/YrhL